MLTERLAEAGFRKVIVLDGAACGYPAYARVVIALWPYEAEATPASGGAWIHPYYFASQQAYLAAASITRELPDVTLQDELRVKPIFARLPGFSQGKNTLSYIEGVGSRFHAQIFTTTEALPVTHRLADVPHPLACGDCRQCMAACPTGAIDEQGFRRERCIRNWMMSGTPAPAALRGAMGNRLIGCDDCQRCCPRNPAPTGPAHTTVPLDTLLTEPKAAALSLRPLIGVNLTIPNRVLGQACLLAGCSGRRELLDPLRPLTAHPSPTVREYAAWAVEQLMNA